MTTIAVPTQSGFELVDAVEMSNPCLGFFERSSLTEADNELYSSDDAVPFAIVEALFNDITMMTTANALQEPKTIFVKPEMMRLYGDIYHAAKVSDYVTIQELHF